MEKLLALLNEYRTEKGERKLNEFEVSQTLDSLNYLRLFIKWLVDNDKIAWRKCLDLWYEIAVIDKEGEDVDIMRTFDDYEQLLMYLAIQDSPIDFLVSILK